jgi:predicted nucleic-acid-binding protein
MMVFDTNIWIRHLTGDPPEQAKLASELIATTRSVQVPDVVIAECVYVLESVYEVERWRVAEMMRSVLDHTGYAYDRDVTTRALELYETRQLNFGDAYVLAFAETWHMLPVATFDREFAQRAESGVRLVEA